MHTEKEHPVGNRIVREHNVSLCAFIIVSSKCPILNNYYTNNQKKSQSYFSSVVGSKW